MPSCNFDCAHYTAWRPSRINKLVSLLGENWFKDKQILEVACGGGQVGKSLSQRGALMTFTTCHESDIGEIKRVNGHESNVVIVDHDREWNLNKQFDLVVHWGLLYHLDKIGRAHV